MLHEVSQSLRDRVQLAMRGQIASALGVLEQSDEHEREHGDGGVQDELPRVHTRDEQDGRKPKQDENN